MRANPFITAIQTYTQSPTAGNLILDKSQITLFSYLTGNHITVSRDYLNLGIYTPGSDLQKWMIMHGGESVKRALVGIEYFSVQRADNIEDYISSLKEISNQLAVQTENYIDIIHHSPKEVRDKLILDIFGDVIMVLGFIPFVGDVLELGVQYLIDEIKISIEDNPDQIKALRKEQKINLGVGAALAIVPGPIGAVVGKVASKVAKKVARTAVGKWAKKGAKKIDSFITGVDTRRLPVSRIDNVFARPGNVLAKTDDLIPANKMTKAELTDGRPNIKLDADGNPKKRLIEPGSKDWKTRCGGRKKRMLQRPAAAACALPRAVYDPIPTTALTTDATSLADWRRAESGQWFTCVLDTSQKKVKVVPTNIHADNKGGLRKLKDNIAGRMGRDQNRYVSGAPGERDGISIMPAYLKNRPSEPMHKTIADNAGFEQDTSLGFTLIKINNEFAQMKTGSWYLNYKPGKRFEWSHSRKTTYPELDEPHGAPQMPQDWVEALKTYISREFVVPHIAVSLDR